MDETRWFLEWWGILAIFATTCLLLHIVLIWMIPLKEVGWKAVDYLWIALTLVSLGVAAGEAKRYMAEIALRNLDYRISFLTRSVQSTLERSTGLLCDLRFQRSESSPPNFDEIVEQQRLGCLWVMMAGEIIRVESAKPEPDLRQSALPITGAVTLRGLRHGIDRLLEEVSAYETENSRRSRLRAEVGPTHDGDMILISPVLLALAFAVRTTKVTGEVLLAKRKSRHG